MIRITINSRLLEFTIPRQLVHVGTAGELLHVVLGPATFCPGAREQAGMAHIPQGHTVDVVQHKWRAKTMLKLETCLEKK